MTRETEEAVALRHADGRERTINVRSGGKVTCPSCGSEAPEKVEIHKLVRVLAGECAVCFHSWTIATLSDWEVKADEQ